MVTTITSCLQKLGGSPLRQASLGLLQALGYQSNKTVKLKDSKPQAFLDLLAQSSPDTPSFDKEKALFSDWVKADLLFQLTDNEISGEKALFEETDLQPGLLKSYLFFAIELNGSSTANGSYARGRLTAIARQINRVFPMPVMVLIKHPDQGQDVLSIAVINRRANKREQHKDVLGRVTIIRDISLSTPHRGHLDILGSFAVPNLRHPDKLAIQSFDTLHTAWEEVFNIELLNKRFYEELANWYFWALPQVDFPNEGESDDKKRRATGLIRLLARLIFCWFIKEKGLIPDKLFHRTDLKKILKDFDPTSNDSSQYYHAILQNLFFATLNQRMGRPSRKDAKPYRKFALDEGFPKNKSTYDVNVLYRYEGLFAEDPDTALSYFADIPFLNGGLFECLDRSEESTNKKLYIDGFSRNPKKRPHLPNHLFFSDEIKNIDLSDTYGDKKRKKESVSGLLRILNRYKFTIVENTPIDQEIALDPELLGKVFENLLVSYNDETKTTARKQTGSFYTPRHIVDYMVDESLKSHLAQALTEKAGASREDAKEGLDILFAYTEREHDFAPRETDLLSTAIDSSKLLYPAFGSGAFPMGVLHKLVFILVKLDPVNDRWKQRQLDAAQAIPDSTAREAATNAIEEAFDNTENDYGRKLYLLENCLYGVDIQPIAIQISKLRFFISLICDYKTNRDKAKNHGIRPLPNLETKFVAADTLISLNTEQENRMLGGGKKIDDIERELQSIRHEHFAVQNRQKKLNLQDRDRKLRDKLANELRFTFTDQETSLKLARWNPYDPQDAADFFDPLWMFDRSLADGFDIVIGNPPYISVGRFAGTSIQTKWKNHFETYAARGDIYCFFYERGAQLLKKGGSLVYITSNKWMRAGYGKALRGFLSSEVDTESVLDFGMAQNFGAATTYTCITRFYNQKPDNRIRSCYATDDRAAVSDPAAYFAEHAVVQPNLSEDAWVVLSKERQRIKTLVEEQGLPLKKWDLQISKGVMTGFNEAFYLTKEQRDTLVEDDPTSEKLIGKLLRGRDVERYGVNWQHTYQLVIPFGAHEDLEERYPAVYRHLCKFETKLKNRAQCKYGRARKAKDTSKSYPGQHHWLELDNNPGDDYLDLFEMRKIMYPNMTKYLPFFLDQGGGYLTNDKGYIINSSEEPLEYLVAFLNSHLFRASFRDNFSELRGNTYEVRKIFVECIPVKRPDKQQASAFAALVPLIQFAKANEHSAEYQFLEDLIDACVLECYFRDHMLDRDLLFLDELSSLEDYNPEANSTQQRAFLEHFIAAHNSPSSKVRNRLLRLTADSPDLLAIIKQEGAV